MELPYSTLAVFVIDMQKRFVSRLHRTERATLIRNQKKVLRRCQELDIQVWKIELSIKKFGVTVKAIRDAIRAVPRDFNHTKTTADAFEGDKGAHLTEQLKKRRIEAIFLMGLNADLCVAQTADGGAGNSFVMFSHEDVVHSIASDRDESILKLAEKCEMKAFEDVLEEIARFEQSQKGAASGSFYFSTVPCPAPRCSYHHR